MFTAIDGVSARGIARFRRSSGKWEALTPGGGVMGAVLSMAYDRGKLYMVGAFNQAGGVNARNVAIFDEHTATWSDLAGGVGGVLMPGLPQALRVAVDGKDVYIVGDFAEAGNIPSAGFAHYRWP